MTAEFSIISVKEIGLNIFALNHIYQTFKFVIADVDFIIVIICYFGKWQIGPCTPGSKGAKGEPGDFGDLGRDGIKGIKGQAGLRGGPGNPGAPGLPGEDGRLGIPGDLGNPGIMINVIGFEFITLSSKTICCWLIGRILKDITD